MTDFGLPSLSEERVKEALQRLGLTEDGRLLCGALWREMSIPSVAPDPCALQVEHGRRMLARQLIDALATKAPESDGGRTEHRGGRKPGWKRAREDARPDT